MSIKFGVTFGVSPGFYDSHSVKEFEELIKMADGYGIHSIGTHDTAFLGGDAYVRATLMARVSEKAQIGLRPTNPLTREPQVMASFLASLDCLSDGRAFIDIASGDSAVLNIGLRPANRAIVREYVECIRNLIRGEDGEFRGRRQRVRWVTPPVREHIPISICAEGPLMLDLGGCLGDMVTSGSGLLPEVVADTKQRIALGAINSGRDPSDVQIWFTARSVLASDPSWAREQAKATVSSSLNHSMRFGLENKLVPAELRGRIQEFVDGYELRDHGVSRGSNTLKMDELGLSQYALDRWGLFGTAEDWIKQIDSLVSIGVEGLWVGFGRGGLKRQRACLKVFGEVVLPHFS